MKVSTFLFLACVLILPQQLSAQKRAQRFGTGFTLGINASQMDGDNQRGYSKIGIRGGVVGIARITPRLDMQIELLYAQRGARPSNNSAKNGTSEPLEIQLNYAETPLLITYKTLESWEGEYRLNLLTGFSYARLISSKIEQNRNGASEVLKEDFRRNDLSWKVGASLRLTPRLLLGIRHSISLTSLITLDDASTTTSSEANLSVYYLTLQATALIF
jgi:hypothetical protein